MRVLFVIDSLAPGGAERSLVALTPHLVARGVEPDVAYLVERPGVHDDLVAGGARLHPLTSAVTRVARVRAVRDLVRELCPDLVHTTLFEADVAGRIGARLASVPSVTSLVNETYGADHRADPNVPVARLRVAQLLDATTARACVRFHAVSQHVARTMARHLCIPRGRIEVVYRGRDAATLGRRTPARVSAARQELGVAPDTTVVLALARHEYQKGLDLLLAALPDVIVNCPKLELFVAGRPGNETAGLQSLARAGRVEASVHFLGARDDVPGLLCAADMLVLPSRREGLPGVLLEAMALETPVVASDLPQVREVVGEDVASLFPPGDTRKLAETLLSVAERPRDAAAGAVRGRERFDERFTIERSADGMLRFYEHALAARRLRPIRRPCVRSRNGRADVS